jgi:hypothetical protein
MQRSARSRYESDAWDSRQSLGSRERAGGDACGIEPGARDEAIRALALRKWRLGFSPVTRVT